MKLFLSSMAISKSQATAFTQLVGKKPKDIKLVLIENAGDVYTDDTTDWVNVNRLAIQSHGYDVEILDLREYINRHVELKRKLSAKDAIWLGGGNTYYLRWILRETGADSIIKKLVQNGSVYGGGSAGAIVAGPTLDHFQKADNPNDAPTILLEGLSLTQTVVIPHIGNDYYGEIMDEANRLLQVDKYKTVAIDDEQAVVIDGDIQKVVS